MPQNSTINALEEINNAISEKTLLVSRIKELTLEVKATQAKVKELDAKLVEPRKIVSEWFTQNPDIPHGEYKRIKVVPVEPTTYKAVITDESLLPKEYMVLKVNTRAVKAALADKDVTIPGAKRVNTPPYIKCTYIK